MDASVLKEVGQIAGIGGLALGVFLLLFREVIRKNIFPKLPAREADRLLRLITGAVWSVTIIGILAWVYVGNGSAAKVNVGSKRPPPGDRGGSGVYRHGKHHPHYRISNRRHASAASTATSRRPTWLARPI